MLIGIEGGLNVYQYVKSRPTTRVDPSGLLTVDGVEMPDPNSGGSVKGKRREYYRRRMRHWGWAGCSWVQFLNPIDVWKFTEHSLRAHTEAMEFYPDPKPAPTPRPPAPAPGPDASPPAVPVPPNA